MPITSSTEFVEALRRNRLLEASQLDELTRTLLPRFPEPRALAKELLDRGWLTAYQVNQFLQGRGSDLVLGQYVLLERLGEGGMGQVFKARHQKLERIVALKLIRKERVANPEALRRFHREIHAASQLSHPNIVVAYDADQVGETHFFVMEYVEGTDLARLVKQSGPLSVPQTCDYLRQAALGLQHAFERGLVHRDIKPANLLLTTRLGAVGSEFGLVKLLDMGLVRLSNNEEDKNSAVLSAPSVSHEGSLTRMGVVIGTPDFMAPEQAVNSHRVDIRSDLYSLGCTGYFLLTGKAPFPTGTTMEKLFKHKLEEPVPLEQLRPEVPAAVAQVLRRLMAKRPEDRYQTPAEAAAALAAVLLAPGEPIAVSETPARSPAATFSYMAASDTEPALDSPWRRRQAEENRRWLLFNISGAAVLLVLLLFLGMVIFRQSLPPANDPDPEDVARGELERLLTPLNDPESDREQVRQQLLDFQVRHPGMAPSLRAARMLMQLPSPLDGLSSLQIPPPEQDAARVGDAGQVPPGLVAVLGDTRLRHWRDVRSVAWGADGTVLASGSLDGTIRLWDAASGRLLHAVTASKARGPLVAFIEDGPLLVSGGVDPVIRLWDTTTGKELRTFSGHKKAVLALAVSVDGQMLASSGGDGTVRLWDTLTGKELRPLQGVLRAPIHALAFGADDQLLAAAGNNGRVLLWNTATGQELQPLLGHTQPIHALAFNRDGSRLAAGGAGGIVRVWDVARGEPLQILSGHPGGVASLVFAGDGETLAVGSETGALKLWNVEMEAVRRVLPGPRQAVLAVAFRADGQVLASGSADGRIRLWDPAAGRELLALPDAHGQDRCVAFSPDSRFLAAGGEDGTLQLWEPGSGKPPRLLGGHTGPVWSAVFSPDGHVLASAGSAGQVKLWETATGKELRALAGHNGQVYAVAFRGDGQQVASGGVDGVVRLWDPATGLELFSLMGHKGAINAVAFSPDGRLLASAGAGGSVKLWDTETGREAHSLIGHSAAVLSVAFSPDGEQLASGGGDGMLQLWDVVTSKKLHTIAHPGQSVPSVAYRADGLVLAAVTSDGAIRLCDPHGGVEKQVLQLAPPGGLIRQTAYCSDGRHLATANSNGTVYILRLPAKP